MYYSNYEDYMRSVLGYPSHQDTYNTYNYSEVASETMQMYPNSERYSDEIMNLYPDIYKIVNPMVCKICDVNTNPITEELIEKMTDEIYLNLEEQPETNTVINVRVNTSNSLKSKTENKSNRIENRESENREDRQRRNPLLRDLIRILILNRLLGGNFPNRPPRPRPRPPRPPMRPPYPRNDMYYENNFRY